MSEEQDGPDVFAERLRAARRLRGIDQAQVAATARLPAASISHFEAGKRKPSFDNLRRLAKALDVSTDYLLGSADDVGLGGAGQALYRHVEKLTEKDRELAESFLKLLASRSEGGKEPE